MVIFNKPTRISIVFIIVIWAILIWSCIGLSSCSGKKGYLKYSRNHPEVVAKDCKEKYPPIETFKPGRIDTVPGKTIEVPGDTVFVKGNNRDTVFITKTKYIHCPPSLICTPDTVTKIDSAAVFLLKIADEKVISQGQKIKELKKDKVLLIIASFVFFLLTCLGFYLWITKK